MKRTYTYQPAAGLGKWVAAAVWLFVLLKISVVAVGVLMLIAVYQPMQTALANQRSLAGLNIPITDTVLNLMNYAETVVFLVSMVLSLAGYSALMPMPNHFASQIYLIRLHGHWAAFSFRW